MILNTFPESTECRETTKDKIVERCEHDNLLLTNAVLAQKLKDVHIHHSPAQLCKLIYWCRMSRLRLWGEYKQQCAYLSSPYTTNERLLFWL